MRILVTGKRGQLALSLAEQARGRLDVEVITVGRPELDLACPETIQLAIAHCRPDLVVSAAAYTAVDEAERAKDVAFAVNAVGAGAVARAAARLGVPVIHVSTDYVFDGCKDGSYAEDDTPAPLGVYGASKLAGERAVAAANHRHLIFRTGWVYSPFGTNFVKTVLNLAENREEIAVVADQWGNPTSALDLADAVLDACLAWGRQTDLSAIYHLVGTGAANRAGLARHVLSASRAHGGPWAHVREIGTTEFAGKARRPRNSCLSTARFAATFGRALPDWLQSVDAAVKRLVSPSDRASRRIS